MTKDDLAEAFRDHGLWLCDIPGKSTANRRKMRQVSSESTRAGTPEDVARLSNLLQISSIQAAGEAFLQLAAEVVSTPGDVLPADLRARLRSWLPGIYRAQGEDVVWPADNSAYHQRLSRLSAAIEQFAPRGAEPWAV